MTPSPSRLRRLPYHTEEETLRIQARDGLHAGTLPSNQPRSPSDRLDGLTGAGFSDEGRGWTAQQPWEHVDVPCLHVCVLCSKYVDPDFLRSHPQKCKVALTLLSAA